MARQTQRQLLSGFLLAIWLLLAGACSVEYVPDAQGTPRPLLRFAPTQDAAPASATAGATITAPSTPAAFVPSPTPRLAPASATPVSTPVLRRLTEPGCCSGIWWSADGTKVLYVDKPDERDTAIWGVDAATGERAPFSTAVGTLQRNDRYVVESLHRTPQSVILHDRETDESWGLYGVGSFLYVSPDGASIAYDGRVALRPIHANRSLLTIVVASLDGGNARFLTSIYGGGIIDWFPDGSRLLVLGTQTYGEQRPALWHVDVSTGAITKLVDAAYMRHVSLSPDGAWVVFLSLFEEDPQLNTTWAINVQTRERRRLNFVGGYAWVATQGASLVYVPLRAGPDEGFAVWQLDVATGERTRLINPRQLPIFIANADWALASDGKRFAFVSANDYAIWLLDLSP